MKIIILTEGGKNIGLGHISRCMSLFNEAGKRGISVEFIINGEVGDVKFIKDIPFINVNWLEKKFLYSCIDSGDYVIVDSYIADKAIYDTIAELSKKALFIDDTGRLNYPKGIILNPTLDASHIDYSNSAYSTLLSGSNYVIVRDPFIGVQRNHSGGRLKRILITMGGTDIRNTVPILLDTVCKKYSDIEFDVVIGSKGKHWECGKVSVSDNVFIHFNVNAAEMKNIMVKADLAISAAGQTIYELLATQTPFIAIQVIENQENNIRALIRYNPNQIVLKYDETDLLKNIVGILKEFDTSTVRLKQVRAYKGLVDGYGSKRAVDELLKDL